MTTTDSSNNEKEMEALPVENAVCSTSFLANTTARAAENVLLPPSDCEAFLEQTVDSCVACVDNVDAQHTYEQVLQKVDSHQLSAQEASQIRLDTMDNEANANTSIDSSLLAFPDIQELNICGTDDLEDAKTTLQHSVHSSSTAQTVNKHRPSSPPTLTCAICLDNVTSFQNTNVTFCHLPCCGTDGREERSSTKVCTACMLLLSSPTSSGDARIGHCPRCRSWLVIKDAGLTIEAVDSAGQCRICNQVKELLVEDKVCDACFLGRTRPLFYECRECHMPQCIPHPMYRYQASVEEYGTTSWACQGPCQNFTTWRILPDQVTFIPAGDAPEEWGDYLETARERVMEARQQMRQLNTGSNTNGGCIVQ